MELVWLEDFLALAKAKNVSRAAEARNVTQPAFSRRLRALEAWLGAPLFERGPRGATLNAAGERALTHAADIADRIHAFRRDIRDISGREAAAVRFGATHALSFSFFPGWIRDHAAGLGAVRLTSDTMAACSELFRRGEIEFLLCHHDPGLDEPFDPVRFMAATVARDELRAFSAPDEAGRPRWRLGAAGAERTLAYGEQSGIGAIVAARRGGAKAAPAFTSELAATLLSLARAGEGIAWLPATLASDAIAAGELVEAGEETAISVDIRLYRPRTRLGPAAEAFWAEIVRGA